MNTALLTDLQRRRSYPSVTVLLNTSPGAGLSPEELATANTLIREADRRLNGDVDKETRTALTESLSMLLDEQAAQPSTHALVLCVSTEHSVAVRLGQQVEERVAIDETFATRDLVADLNRTAVYRVVTVSEQMTRVFLGDRIRVVEERNTVWPLHRTEEQSLAAWNRTVLQHLRNEHATFPLPTVIGGVARSVRSLVGETRSSLASSTSALSPALSNAAGSRGPVAVGSSFRLSDCFDAVGFFHGNHDRSNWSELHRAAWPLVSDWLRTESNRALFRLEQAKSSARFAGGIDEIWPLAKDGRVELLIVEESYSLAVRLAENEQLRRAPDPDAPDVVDDIIDEVIEEVLLQGGQVVFVADESLVASTGSGEDRIAAILRF
jgi:Bacterial archaeo-eukaryotic release factor family 3